MLVTFLFLHKHTSTDILAQAPPMHKPNGAMLRNPTDEQMAECYKRSITWGANYAPPNSDVPDTRLISKSLEAWPTCGYNPRCCLLPPFGRDVPWPRISTAGLQPEWRKKKHKGMMKAKKQSEKYWEKGKHRKDSSSSSCEDDRFDLWTWQQCLGPWT